jgi:hypothetical protein
VHILRYVALALLVGCGTLAPDKTDTGTDTGPEECRDEGESCTAYEGGTSNCCNGRHTCFPEGCYYVQPQ